MDISLWKKRKKELHWTHDDLARESGISRRTIAGIFAGDPRYQSPTLNTIESIEKALGIGEKSLEWTDKEKALGVGDHPTVLSEEEWEWLELRSEALRLKGKEYVEMLERMIKAAIETK